MFTLKIKESNGALFWTEYFNELDKAVAWLAAEKTRSYWKPGRTFEFYLDEYLIPMVNGVPTIDAAKQALLDKAKADEAAAIQAKTLAKKTAYDALKSLKKGDLKNLSDAEDALLRLIEALGLK